jgi:hypothetical protein
MAPPIAPGSIEHCAVIAASLARRPADQAAILAENHLSEDDWDALEHRWTQVLRKEAQQGGAERLAAYDQAFVARLEEERGPITPEEYARLALAHERSRDAHVQALRDLGLPWGATPRIQRVYTERMAADPALSSRVRAALADR